MNDQIVAWFDPKLGQKVREILFDFPEIVLPSSENKQENHLVKRVIPLNRPDTLDEGMTNFYIYRTHLLLMRLKALGASAEINVAFFSFP